MRCGKHTLRNKRLHLSKLDEVFITNGGWFDLLHTTLTYLTPRDNDRMLEDVTRIEGQVMSQSSSRLNLIPPLTIVLKTSPKGPQSRDRRQNLHQPHTSRLLNGFLAFVSGDFWLWLVTILVFPTPTGTSRNVVVSWHNDSTWSDHNNTRPTRLGLNHRVMKTTMFLVVQWPVVRFWCLFLLLIGGIFHIP